MNLWIYYVFIFLFNQFSKVIFMLSIFLAEYVQESGTHVVDMAYAPLIGGFCIVLSNGTAALLTSPSSRFLPKVTVTVTIMLIFKIFVFLLS